METLNPEPQFEPTIIGAAWRYRWLVLITTLIGGALAFSYALAGSTTEYEATASMVVEDPRSSILFDVGSRQRREDYLADQIQILRSGAVASLAATRAGDILGREVSTVELLDSIAILGSEDSSLISIRATMTDPEIAVASATAMLGAYQEFLSSQTQNTYGTSIQVLDETIDRLRDEVVTNRGRIAELTTETNPDLVQLNEQVGQATSQLVDLIERLASADDASREVIRAGISDVLLQIQAFNALSNIEQASPELTELLLAQERLVARINELAERRDRIRLDSLLLSSGVTASIPAFQANEVSTQLPRTSGVGLALGGIAGFALAYGLALRNRNFNDRSEPETILNSPLIAEVPNFKQEGIRTSLPVRSDPRTASAEAFRFAATALAITGSRVIAVASAGANEGKTVVAANIGLAAAREGNRVLLVDADFGNQMATALLVPGTVPEAGITEVVESNMQLADAIVEIEGTGTGGLHLLSRGWRQTAAPEFFRFAGLRQTLDQLRDYYDLVLIDSPPLLQVAYASTIVGLSEGVLLVVPHEAPVSTAEEVRDRLELIGTRLVGYIYNVAPLRLELTRTEGSMKDVLGTKDVAPA